MDCVEFVLQCAGPIPYLAPSYGIFKTIWSAVEEVRASRGQFKVLAEAVAALLQILDRQHRALGKISKDSTVGAVNELETLLNEIASFIRRQSSYSFIRSLLLKTDRQLALIDEFHQRLAFSVNAFQIAALFDIRRWQSKNDEARLRDQDRLHAQLRELQASQRLLIEVLDISQKTPMAIIATLQRCVNERRGDQEELRFLTHSLQYLKTASGQHVDLKLEPWTITSFDVEFGSLIGVGGYSKVFRGKWNHADVALKVIKKTGDIATQAAAVRRWAETCSKLLHPNILEFWGANILDDQPFLVMPLIEGGNARDYMGHHPACNRLKIIQQVALGITYLHSQRVMHGDLKAVNVLIDKGERALLCNFGLAAPKADVNVRSTTAETRTLLESPNWMAPELFSGHTLRYPCDVYSFAMTVYEIYTHEIPFGSVPPALLAKLVVKRQARPDRPSDLESPHLTEPIWQIVEQCWMQQPEDRPTAKAVCEQLSALLKPGFTNPYLSPSIKPSVPLEAISDHAARKEKMQRADPYLKSYLNSPLAHPREQDAPRPKQGRSSKDLLKFCSFHPDKTRQNNESFPLKLVEKMQQPDPYLKSYPNSPPAHLGEQDAPKPKQSKSDNDSFPLKLIDKMVHKVYHHYHYHYNTPNVSPLPIINQNIVRINNKNTSNGSDSSESGDDEESMANREP